MQSFHFEEARQQRNKRRRGNLTFYGKIYSFDLVTFHGPWIEIRSKIFIKVFFHCVFEDNNRNLYYVLFFPHAQISAFKLWLKNKVDTFTTRRKLDLYLLNTNNIYTNTKSHAKYIQIHRYTLKFWIGISNVFV